MPETEFGGDSLDPASTSVALDNDIEPTCGSSGRDNGSPAFFPISIGLSNLRAMDPSGKAVVVGVLISKGSSGTGVSVG